MFDRRLLNWGIFFILLGAIPLAVRQGYLSADTVGRWWALWPLLLVAVGAGILLSRTSFEFLGGAIVAATFGVMAGGLIAGGFAGVPFGNCSDEQGAVAFASRDGSFGPSATVRLELNCGTMTVGSGPGSAWRLEGSDEDGSGPQVDAASGSLRIRSTDDNRPFDFLSKRDIWRITLPEATTLDLDVSINAGRATFDLGAVALSGLRADVNAGDLRVDLSRSAALPTFDLSANAGSLKVTLPGRTARGSVKANAGSIELCTPPGAGVRVRLNDDITAGNNFATQGLTRNGSTWETPGYAGATVQLDLEAEVHAGSVNLNPAGGCNA